MRSFMDRVRHATMFEVIGLAIFIPGSAFILDKPAAEMGVIGVVSATTATVWNFLFNLGFDKAMLRFTGSVNKSMAVRVLHAILFEAGLIVLLIPFIAWYLGISLITALVMDIAIVVFYLVYAFVFNIAYDRLFPLPFGHKAKTA
ncbi:PACE efflux transporter [Brucella tritici]|uniref:PACE efflux transporter n=1 Tax=Brucella tritici TaxID=94626 RepID=A0A7X6FTZ6_9HYPH|nr:PACE efflux transporter [Brucella tritici]KAB2663821.1 PACE efflux transporter [Brucella tritici]NKW11035.1 PACE efflux transporter [Brucella tritici]